MQTLQPLYENLRYVWPRASKPRAGESETVVKIRQQAAAYEKLRKSELPGEVQRLKEIVERDPKHRIRSVLVPGLALVSEAARRTLGIQYYDVQLLAGLALSQNAIAEMKTGEGKTYVGALASFIHALKGRGVHFMTTNAYLAERDWEQIAPVFEILGMSVGLLQQDMPPAAKQKAYACDVTYGPGYDFGFDYLRDQIALLSNTKRGLGEEYQRLRRGAGSRAVTQMQRGHSCAIIDEVDSVLLDEATTPLVLSSGSDQPSGTPELYFAAMKTADNLEDDVHYVIDASAKSVRLTEEGVSTVYSDLQAAARGGLQRPWPEYVEQALHASLQLTRDVDYIVKDDKVQIVDENTGRVFAERTWRDGLHQAVQVKESVTISEENHPIARISRQQYFRLYDSLCGMTGTALGSEREFWNVYRLPVDVIPTRKPCRRQVFPTRFFDTADSKWSAIAEVVARIHKSGQPILVGTRTIENSEAIAVKLEEIGIPYRLLNGKQDADEARVVAGAGQRSAVTIATNMAGRGTDIKLGPGVAELEGLHVIVTEPHESARIDRQLMGRAARQGDPGTCQVFVSGDDSLIKRHAAWLGQYLRKRADDRGEVTAKLDHDVASLQRKTERDNYAKRRQLFAQESWFEDVLSKLAKES
ncbi:MAG: preprotein translocase subunit SecA [Planctomycetota bacterium]|nr:preprotein translocase subunit SecA [Planctomycetota bacterium]